MGLILGLSHLNSHRREGRDVQNFGTKYIILAAVNCILDTILVQNICILYTIPPTLYTILYTIPGKKSSLPPCYRNLNGIALTLHKLKGNLGYLGWDSGVIIVTRRGTATRRATLESEHINCRESLIV